jgi:DNA repair protein RadD
MPAPELRAYQTEAIEKIRQSMVSGKRRVILQASCGAGKTIISAEIVSRAIEKGNKVLFLVNRRDLVKQTIDKYDQFGLGDEIGIILAGEDPHLGRPIQVGSLQTYGRRIKLNDGLVNKWFHNADLLIYDECHSANAPTYRQIIDMYGDKRIIGLSATPMGAKATGLGDVFEEIITCIPTAELVKLGHLVPAVHYAPSKPDLKGVGILAGDYNLKELGARVDKPKLIGDLLENWLNIAPDRKTIVFATNVKHSKHIRDRFTNNGISIAHIDAHTNDEERVEIYKNFEHGDLQVITNVGVACEGSDLPICGCICVCKPTRVLSRWLQMAGRGARPYPGKEDYLLLDFAGCIDEHGLVDDPVEWDLDAKKPAARKKVVRKKEKHLMTCEYCSTVFTGKRCPMCGNEVKDWGKKIEALDAELVEVKKSAERKLTTQDKRRWYGMFKSEMQRLGKTEKWLLAQYKSKTGVWPRNMEDVPSIEADLECKNWLTHQRVKWANSKRKQEKANA